MKFVSLYKGITLTVWGLGLLWPLSQRFVLRRLLVPKGNVSSVLGCTRLLIGFIQFLNNLSLTLYIYIYLVYL